MLRPIAFLRLALCSAVGAGLMGCGSSSPAGPPTNPVTPSTLGGNWLLVGSLPPLFQPLTSTATDFALSVQVEGGAITAVPSLETICPSGTGSGDNLISILQGTVAADGSFSLTLQPAVSGVSLTVSGNVPKTEGASWAGKYVYSNAANTSCIINISGSFQATPVANIQGAYSGQGPLQEFEGTLSPAPATGTMYGFTQTLQQGATLPSSSVESAIGLSGSIQTTGFPCFSKGQMSTTFGGIVEGDIVEAFFTMDDGSTMNTLGTISNIASSALTLSIVQVSGGNCAGVYIFDPLPIVLSR